MAHAIDLVLDLPMAKSQSDDLPPSAMTSAEGSPSEADSADNDTGGVTLDGFPDTQQGPDVGGNGTTLNGTALPALFHELIGQTLMILDNQNPPIGFASFQTAPDISSIPSEPSPAVAWESTIVPGESTSWPFYQSGMHTDSDELAALVQDELQTMAHEPGITLVSVEALDGTPLPSGWDPIDIPIEVFPGSPPGFDEAVAEFTFHQTLNYDFASTWDSLVDVGDFFDQKGARALVRKSNPDVGDDVGIRLSCYKRPDIISGQEPDSKHYDLQGIDWEALGIDRGVARLVRTKLYGNYCCSRSSVSLPSRYLKQRKVPQAPIQLPDTDHHFRFRYTHTKYKPYVLHWQLRNVMSASSKISVFYAHKHKVICVNPDLGTSHCAIDLSKDRGNLDLGVCERVSTLCASDGVLVVGGIEGTYAMKSLSADYDRKPIVGIITEEYNKITNHVHAFLDRRSGLPQAVFSSNDAHVRTLDCYTNRFIRNHTYDWPVNCTAISPDGRLRLLAADDCEPWVVNAETGAEIVRLRNHKGHGFSCAWAPDGVHIATGNEDDIVQVWDARMWNQPLQIITTEMGGGGVRSIHFSPIGGGKRVLVLAEPADIISVVDAQTFQTTQRFDFFGEIAGASIVPDGSALFVANSDCNLGGLLEFERTGYGERYGIRRPYREELEAVGDAYLEKKSFEWVAEEDLDDDGRCLHLRAGRKRRGLELGGLVW